MNIIDLPKEAFKIKKLQDLEKNGVLKDNLDAINYVYQYYFETKNGMFFFYDVRLDTFEMKTSDDFKKEVINKFVSKKINDQFRLNSKIYTVVSRIGKPRVYYENDEYFLNEGGSFLHQKYKQYDEYSEEIKSCVQMILDLMKVISCDNDEDVFKAYILWYAQIARGIKTECIPTRVSSVQGIGKTTEPRFFTEFVFGLKVCLQYNKTEAITGNFNKIFLGKLLIVLEDLQELGGDAECRKFASSLKTLCTEKYSIYRDVFEKPIQAENISNFIITSNYNIKDSEGRRIIPLDMNLSRRKDYSYFSDIEDKCFNNQVGEAMFSYLLTKISDEEAKKFYGQRDFPVTQNKRIAIATTLSSVHKFIKFEYVLKKKNISKIVRGDFYLMYVDYCTTNNFRKCGKNEFYKKLEEVAIKATKNNGDHYYNYSEEQLTKISNDEKWICKYDDFEVEDIPTYNVEEIDYKSKYEDLLSKYNDLLKNKV